MLSFTALWSLRRWWCGVMALVFLTGAPQAVHAGLIAYWDFNEASGSIAHDSTGSFNGTLQGNATFVPAGGISGGAIQLNAATGDLVNMGNVLGLTSGDFSIQAWIKTAPGATGFMLAAGKHEAFLVAGYFLGLSGPGMSTGQGYFYDSEVNPSRYATSTTLVNDGNWHQLVGVYHAGGTDQLYVDGVLESTQTAEPIGANPAPFLVGGDQVGSTPTSFFTGFIDEVRVYDNALTAVDVASLFANPSGLTAAPEPASATLMGLGLAGLIGCGWRRRRG